MVEIVHGLESIPERDLTAQPESVKSSASKSLLPPENFLQSDIQQERTLPSPSTPTNHVLETWEERLHAHPRYGQLGSTTGEIVAKLDALGIPRAQVSRELGYTDCALSVYAYRRKFPNVDMNNVNRKLRRIGMRILRAQGETLFTEE